MDQDFRCGFSVLEVNVAHVSCGTRTSCGQTKRKSENQRGSCGQGESELWTQKKLWKKKTNLSMPFSPKSTVAVLFQILKTFYMMSPLKTF